MRQTCSSLGGGYFDINSEDKPFLHIWSLSVEEQFYFIFPLFLILLVSLDRRLSAKHTTQPSGRIVYIGLIGFLILSLASSFLPLNNLGFSLDAYYLPHTRFGEMLVGSLLAVYLCKHKPPRGDSSFACRAKVLGSLAFLILLLIFFPQELFVSPWFPGPLALLPCIATTVLIYYNTERYWVSRLLSSRLVVWIGRLSYSLYLWHWLVLAFVRYFYGTGAFTPAMIVSVSGVILLLSIASYYAVEQPIRQLSLSFRTSLLCLYVLPASIVVLYWWMPKNYYPISSDLTSIMWDEEYFDNLDKRYYLGDTTATPSVLVAGDSHTGHLAGFIDEVGKVEGWSAYLSSLANCPFLFDYACLASQTKNEDHCLARNEMLAREYEQYSTIVLASFWGGKAYANDPDFIPNLEKTLKKLLESGKKIIMINSAYRVRNTRLREGYLIMQGLMKPLERSPEHVRGEEFERCERTATKLKALITEKFPEIEWIDLIKYQPKDLLFDGIPIMRDNTHLNLYGSRMVAHEFIRDRKLVQ